MERRSCKGNKGDIVYKRCLEVLDHSLTKALVFSGGFLMCLDNKVSYAILTALVYWSVVIFLKEKVDEKNK